MLQEWEQKTGRKHKLQMHNRVWSSPIYRELSAHVATPMEDCSIFNM